MAKHVLSIFPKAQNIAHQTQKQKLEMFKMFFRMFGRVQNLAQHVKTF